MSSYGRHREETILDESVTCKSYKYIGTNGTCTTSAGPAISPFGATITSTRVGNISRVMDDMVTPNFRKIQKTGGIINNPMESVYTEDIIPAFSFDLNSGWDSFGCVPQRYYTVNNIRTFGERSMSNVANTGLIPLPGDPIDVDRLKDLAINSAWSNIGSQEMLALSTAKEMNQTVQGLAWLLAKAARIAKAVRKKQLRQLKREITWKEMQEVYMNARYNLRPLSYEIRGLMAIIEKGCTSPQRQTFRGYETEDVYASESSSELFETVYSLQYHIDIMKVASRKVQVRAGVLTAADAPSYAQLMGLDRLVETMWDLTPYSFILDWFANVGTTISAWTPVMGFNTLASWVTVEEIETQKTYITGMSTNGSRIPYGGATISDKGFSCVPCTRSLVTKRKYRIPNYSRSILPTIDLKLDPLKLLDLAIIGKNIRKNAAYVR